jgi:glycosyltransferase involved in cell wall biosynthesis
MKPALSSLVPLSVKTKVVERLNRAKLERLLRTKKRFRNRQRNGTRPKRNVPPGINLVAYMRAEMGIGTAARGMATAFYAVGIPFNVINFERGSYASHTNDSWVHKEVRQSRYDITVVCVNPDNSFNLRTHVSPEVLGNRYVIGYWFWELPEMPDAWLSDFEFTDEVWAASNFIKDAISGKAPVPVVRVPPVVQLTRGRRFSRSELGLPAGRFLFLGMFDTKSVLHRKNPLGVLRAFSNAFRPDDASVGLVLKFNDADYALPVLQAICEEMAGRENVFVIDRTLHRDELSSLIAVSDCFVSLHRSEGFGLGPAEAMSLGKPAIITNWSGNRDYMTSDNCIAIDYKLVQVGEDYGPYKANQYWAEADLEHATHWMKRIVHEPELAKNIGLNGRQTIASQFSPEAVGKIIEARLQQVRDMQ